MPQTTPTTARGHISHAHLFLGGMFLGRLTKQYKTHPKRIADRHMFVPHALCRVTCYFGYTCVQVYSAKMEHSLVRVHATVLERVEGEGGVVRVLARHLAHLDVSAGRHIRKRGTKMQMCARQLSGSRHSGKRTRRGRCDRSTCPGLGCAAGNISYAEACSAHFAGTGTGGR